MLYSRTQFSQGWPFLSRQLNGFLYFEDREYSFLWSNLILVVVVVVVVACHGLGPYMKNESVAN